MNRQAVNPYLPSWEYIPDGEPHVFNGRVYVYGSHDRFNAPIFCVNDYVCWSAPVEDLSEWRYEGVIYRKKQDPKNPLGYHLLFAPDVCQGPDGRYYLYYAFDFLGIMSVAVCDTPAGEYKFLGHIHYADGTLWGRRRGDQLPFDPGVLADDDGRVWLYSGFYNAVPAILTGGHKLRCDGGTVLELEKDMVTIKTEPRVIFPKKGPGAFQGHEFFEASSIRKEGKTYIFVYSSRHNHELCYATSQSPDRDFSYGGTLVSQGDIFLDSNLSEKHAANYLGNTHGGLLKLEDKWYVFYHRQTNRHSTFQGRYGFNRDLHNQSTSLLKDYVNLKGLVRKERLELSRVAPLEPKSSASTNFATFAEKGRALCHPSFDLARYMRQNAACCVGLPARETLGEYAMRYIDVERRLY